MTKDQKMIRAKAGLLELAKQLGNVSQACKIMGFARQLLSLPGTLRERRRARARGNHPPRAHPQEPGRPRRSSGRGRARAEQPAWGQVRVSNELRKRGLHLAIRRALRLAPPRPGDHQERLKALEAKMAQERLVLTEARSRPWRRPRRTRRPMASSRASARATAAPRTRSMSARSRAWGASTSRPSIDTYSKVGFAKLYDRKTPITAADLLNDRVHALLRRARASVSRVLTDRGTEYCGNHESHEYQLYLAVENIDHTRTKARSPQTNGICERFHKTMLDEFYRVAFRKKLYSTITSCRSDLDAWIGTTTTANPSRPLVLRQDPDADVP